MLFLLFIGLPLLELWILLSIGDLIGGVETLALVVVTGVIGAALAKREGTRLLAEIQASVARGEIPEEGLVSGLLLLVAGVCLVTPGVVTDAFGLSMLIGPARRAVARRVRDHFGARIQVGAAPGPFGFGFGAPGRAPGPGHPGASDGEFIDIEAVIVDVEASPNAEANAPQADAESPRASETRGERDALDRDSLRS